MNLVTSFIWLLGGVLWCYNAINKSPYCWILAILSFLMCILFGVKYFKEKRK